MKQVVLFSFALTVAIAAAHPFWPGQHGGQWAWGGGGRGRGGRGGKSPYNHTHPWRPSHWGYARSPCPALNTLANEGFLPPSGRNITPSTAATAFKAALNFDTDFITAFAFAALAQCSNITATPCTSFDLDMLNVPHMIEHDGSLSRADFDFGAGDNHDFDARAWSQVLDVWSNASVVDFSLAQSARVARVRAANASDAPGWFEAREMQSLGETAFYLSAFGDPVRGMARKDWVHCFFAEERLPWHLGWNASQRGTVTAKGLIAMIGQLAAAEVVL